MGLCTDKLQIQTFYGTSLSALEADIFRNPVGHAIPVGFRRDGSQFHYSSRDWDRTGIKKSQREQAGRES